MATNSNNLNVMLHESAKLHELVQRRITDSIVMVVDDLPENIEIVKLILKSQGLRSISVLHSTEVLQAAQQHVPDLILLDISMPEIDGIEVCRLLKADEFLRHIPVVFVSSLTEKATVVRGLQAGAVDYVSKPFDIQELLARVRTHLEIKHSRELLRLQNEQLRQMQTEKDEFLGIAAHDMKNPLTAIQGLAEFITSTPTMPTSEIHTYVQTIYNSSVKMFHLVENLLDINRIETQGITPQIEQFNLVTIAELAITNYRAQAEAKNVEIAYLATEPVFVRADGILLPQVLDNLISNALKYSPSGKKIHVCVTKTERIGHIEVRDEGQGISAEELPKLFRKFARLSTRPTGGESSTGLGLFIVKVYVEAMQGRVWCESEYGKGARFIVELPLTQAA